MKILGIDTSSKFFCLGIYDNGKIYEYNLETGIKLSSLITVNIKRAMDSIGWRIEDIDFFACGLGPGSFTGLRIGITTIKGLSWAAKKPVIGVPSLDILAMNVKCAFKPVIPIIDAKRSLIYCSVYKEKNGRLNRITPYMLLGVDELLKNILPGSILLGDAVSLYRDKIMANIKGVSFLDKDYWILKPRHLITLALQRIKDKKFNDAFNIKPIYLYPKECQVKK